MKTEVYAKLVGYVQCIHCGQLFPINVEMNVERDEDMMPKSWESGVGSLCRCGKVVDLKIVNMPQEEYHDQFDIDEEEEEDDDVIDEINELLNLLFDKLKQGSGMIE